MLSAGCSPVRCWRWEPPGSRCRWYPCCCCCLFSLSRRRRRIAQALVSAISTATCSAPRSPRPLAQRCFRRASRPTAGSSALSATSISKAKTPGLCPGGAVIASVKTSRRSTARFSRRTRVPPRLSTALVPTRSSAPGCSTSWSRPRPRSNALPARWLRSPASAMMDLSSRTSFPGSPRPHRRRVTSASSPPPKRPGRPLPTACPRHPVLFRERHRSPAQRRTMSSWPRSPRCSTSSRWMPASPASAAAQRSPATRSSSGPASRSSASLLSIRISRMPSRATKCEFFHPSRARVRLASRFPTPIVRSCRSAMCFARRRAPRAFTP